MDIEVGNRIAEKDASTREGMASPASSNLFRSASSATYSGFRVSDPYGDIIPHSLF